MSKLKYKIVDIKQSECQTTRREVPEWEIPVLAVIFPDITIVGEKIIKREPPEALDEFRRLARRYHSGKAEDGSPEEVSIVAKVYGAFGIGNRALEKAIQAATVEDEPTADVSDLLGEVPQVSSVGG